MGFKQNESGHHGRYITREEFSQYVDRVREAFDRIDGRMKLSETNRDDLYKMTSNIEKIAFNVENMLENMKKQDKRIHEHDERLDLIETKGSKKWEDILEHIWKYIAVAIVGYVLFKAGIFQVP